MSPEERRLLEAVARHGMNDVRVILALDAYTKSLDAPVAPPPAEPAAPWYVAPPALTRERVDQIAEQVRTEIATDFTAGVEALRDAIKAELPDSSTREQA